MHNLHKLVIQQCIQLNLAGDIYYDFTTVINNKHDLAIIVEGFKQIINRLKIDTIVGHGYGGAQLVGAITSSGMKVDGVVVRSDPHPTQKRQIEGSFALSKRVLIIDDAIFTGKTVDKLKKVLEPWQWNKIVGISVIYDDWRPDGTRRVEQQYQLNVHPLVHRHDIGLTRDAATGLNPDVYNQLLIHKQPIFSQLLLADYDAMNRTIWEMKSSPVFHGDSVINAVDNYTTTCYDTNTLSVKWQIKSAGGIKGVTAPEKGVVQYMSIASDGFLYMAGYDGGVKKIDPNTGHIEWETKIDRYVHSTPVFLDNKIYLNTESWFEKSNRGGGMTCCIDALTGRPIWQHLHDDYCPSTVLVADGHVYAGSNDGTFTCFTLEGEIKWVAVLNSESKVPAIKVDDHIFVLDLYGSLYKFDLTGKRIWRVRATSQGWEAPPLYYQGLIITYSRNRSMIYGIDPISGKREWMSKLRSPCVGLQLLSDDDLLVSSTNTHMAYYKKLDKIWELNDVIPGCKLASQAVVNNSRNLIAFNMQRGGFHIYKLT